MGVTMVSLTPVQYDLIYNMLSLGLASMAASTVFFFLRLGSFAERYKAALCFTGLVTFIAMYHYFRIFDSFNAAFTPCKVNNEPGEIRILRHWDPIQRRIPICRLVPHRAPPSHRDRACYETLRGRDLPALLHPWHLFGSNDCQRVPWRDHWRCWHPLGVLGALDGPIHLHRVHAFRRPEGVAGFAT